MRPPTGIVVLATGAAAAAAAAGCMPMNNLGGLYPSLNPPAISVSSATLISTPSSQQLAAYYCPDVVSVPLGGAAMMCQGLFGPRPSPESMAIAFDVRLKVTNPNELPLPMASVLAAITVYPGQGNQQVGATCVQLCPDGAGTCPPQDPANACQASSHDIRSLSDFANAAAGLMVSNGLAAAAGQTPSFAAPTVAAGGETEVVARFSLAPVQLLRVMRQLAEQSVGDLEHGRAPSFAIPYRLEGTIWFDAGSFGRIAIPWGPTSGTWAL